MRSIVVKLIPHSLKEPLKGFLSQLSAKFMTIFSVNGVASSIYYLVFNRSFAREHRAALLGKIAFQKKLSEIEDSSALLRRNIHRLEKGLIMQPRRDVFAEGYILETVVVYQKALGKNSFCQEETRWAFDVLTSYFEAVKDEGRIVKARELFSQLSQLPNDKPEIDKSIPYSHEALPESTIGYEQILALFTRRRSVRWYQDKPVSKSLLEQAVNASSLAPSACNRQPFFYKYTTDPSIAADVAKCAMGTVGFAENLPALFVVVGDLSNYPAERDRHVIYIDASLSAMQLMLALETLGLSSCPINWPDIEGREKMMQEKLGLNYYERPVMLIAVGYAQPQGGIPFSQKKGTDLLLREIK